MILKSNETTKDSILTPNSENVNYPATNILDSRLSRHFRTVAATTTATIVFDAGSAVTVDSISIANHNISSGVSTFKIQGNATDAWGAPSVDEDLTRVAGIITKSFTGGSYRYWRLHIIDAGNTDTYIKLGRVYLADSYTTPDVGRLVGPSTIDHSVKSKSIVGGSYGDLRYQNLVISGKYPKVTPTQRNELNEQNEYNTYTTPFFITYDETQVDFGTMYVTRNSNSLNFNLLADATNYEASWSYEEEKG